MELVAESGSHALTHRRIDRRLGLPEGTASNYARSRRALVRMALSLDYMQDEEQHQLLTADSPVRVELLVEVQRMLSSLRVPDPDERAVDFIGIMNGLLFDRLAGNGVRGGLAWMRLMCSGPG